MALLRDVLFLVNGGGECADEHLEILVAFDLTEAVLGVQDAQRASAATGI